MTRARLPNETKISPSLSVAACLTLILGLVSLLVSTKAGDPGLSVRTSLLLVAGALLEALSRSRTGCASGSGWPALALVGAYPGLHSSWLFPLQLLLAAGGSGFGARAARALACALPVAVALVAARLVDGQRGLILALILFVVLNLVSGPERGLTFTLSIEEVLWFGALSWASDLGVWPLAGVLTVLLMVHAGRDRLAPDLRQSLAQQMSTTERTLKATEQRFKLDKGKFQAQLARQRFLDHFQIQALQSDSEKEVAESLLRSSLELDPEARIGIEMLSSGKGSETFLTATSNFCLQEFHPLPERWRDGQPLRSSCGKKLFYALNNDIIFMRLRAREYDGMHEELLEQLLNRARLIVRILEHRRELAALLREKTAALKQLSESQSRLLHSEKMASIGQLAAGVAHEINSPLAAISLQLQMAGRRLKKQDLEGVGRSLQTCQLATERAKSIIDGLLNFSRFSDGAREFVQLETIARQTLAMLEAQIEDAQLETQVRIPELPPIEVNAHEIGQILTNIIRNAIDALGEKEGKRRLMVSADLLEGAQRLTIANNGPPISPEVMEKLFNPFFTTKEVGKGTGLGLSLAYQLAKSHQGELTVENHNGWVHFSLILPGSRG